ncbi:ABC transporter permease subunit [Roseovarius sp. S1116L3]|uniref:ABC transporter permease subunit n=1 Tax=Roseovarius roseus TaxID=3342636 RepID=UPI00372A4585
MTRSKMRRAMRGANNWQVFCKVTLRLVLPGVMSAAIFAFLLFWGNLYVTHSLAGTARTLPSFAFSGIAVGSSPGYPALATDTVVPVHLRPGLADWFRRGAAARQASSFKSN